MSEMINFPRYGADQAQLKLERAEAVINAFCERYEHLVALFTRCVPAARDADALTTHRASLSVSA